MISRRGALLAAGLVLASLLVFQFRSDIPETRRFVLALALAGVLFGPLSERPLRLVLWLSAVAAVAWAGRFVGTTGAGLGPWLACSVAGAVLAVRGGSRLGRYLLPEAGEEGRKRKSAIRRQLQAAGVLYLAVYVLDGWAFRSDAYVFARAAALALAAVLFLRYLLLQSKSLGLPAAPLPRPTGLVPAQRWPLLLLFALVGSTRLAETLLPAPLRGPLLVTSALLFFLAGLVFVLGLARGAWSRRFIRAASFVAGMVLAVALAAVLVEIQGLAPRRFAVFSALCALFLVVLPFAAKATRLFDRVAHADALHAAPIQSVMLAPVTAICGPRFGLPSSGLLFALALLIVLYWLVLAFRSGGPLRLYLSASLAVMGLLFVSDGVAWSESGSAWQVFFLSMGFVLYAIDRVERWSVAKGETP